MKTIGMTYLLGLSLSGLFPPGSAMAAEAGVNLKDLRSIAVSEDSWESLEPMAKTMAKVLNETYELDLQIVRGQPERNEAAILLGRSLAIAGGLIRAEELEAVKHDGYVVRGANNRIAVAGYRAVGTRYAVYALLQRLGIKFYPWHNMPRHIRTFTPLKSTRLGPFALSARPFFEWRSLALHLDRDGAFGCSLNDTGDAQRAANPELFSRKRKPGYTKYPAKKLGTDWVDSQHTAGYLVPRDLYYESHPEYFAMHRGKRIEPATYMRMPLCLTNPNVWRISTERALEWIEMQKDRRFFWVMDADAAPRCTCPECLRAEYQPGWYSDRLLNWVNTVARAVKAKYPDKIVLTAAYIESAVPPTHVKPESNVRVLYAPWYWTSRAGPSNSFAHPRNITAMEQFMGWCMWSPGQVGLYAYPYSEYLWLRCQVENVKLCARNNARFIYFCGRAEVFAELFQYVLAKLIWDPFLDAGELEKEFCHAFYGPAAEPMLRYFALDHAVAERTARVYYDPEYLAKAPTLLKQAEKLAQGDEDVLFRTQEHLLAWLERYLPAIRPRSDAPVSKDEYEAFRSGLSWYDRMNRSYRAKCERLEPAWLRKWLPKQRSRGLRKLLASCSFPDDRMSGAHTDRELMKQVFIYFDELAKKQAAPPETAAEKRRSVVLRFDSDAAIQGWELDATQAELISRPTFAKVRCPDGSEISGGKVALPMSRLPMVEIPAHPEGVNKLHAGRFLLTAKLRQPLDAEGCRHIEFRFWSSRDVPITVYMDFGGVGGQRADFHLHAGEQIVRVDVKNFHRVDPAKWDKKIHGIMVDFWPQDNLYPFPAAQDTEVLLAEVAARNFVPEPADLPHRDKAAWLTQYRANLQHTFVLDRKHWRRTRQTRPHTERDRYWQTEKFRSFTNHRALSPIFAILTSASAAPPEKEAAQAIQDYLRRMCGVTLPIDPPGLLVSPHCGNAIIIGRQAGLASGLITEAELEYVGPEGFVIRAHRGRIVIAGSHAQGTAFGVARYLEDHGVVFRVPGAQEKVPTLEGGFLHELYVLEWPHFKKRPIPVGWKLMSQAPSAASAGSPGRTAESVVRMANAIKSCARRGEEIPPPLIEQANASSLSRYVAAKLLWNPFADTTRLVQEYVDR